ncbi:unnamed protein product [Mycena citricolor]|uniref:Arrestin C-terminal-like domain-containing protein n=1 Tax=Mycena citricolor TaxID=2018698 RepID=A0AAD2H340_9AGAR|nr:unnamed protein product [Mycena citricolor]
MLFFRSKNAHHDEGSHSNDQQLEVLLDHEYLFLSGTGLDVEPAHLSGRVVLNLSEPTTIRSVSLQFRGKTYLSVPPQDSQSTNNPPSTYVLCKHHWSFLEGRHKHSYTLQAGRHIFPFQLLLGGSLPSSIVTDAFGGAFVSYKLKATVERAGFSLNHNITATAPVYIIRSLSASALEYQQTLEIEHPWADKLLFSIAIPHKAWAAGDDLVALLKVSPLVKGVGVLSITTSVKETTKLYSRAESVTRTVASVTHEIVGGKAVVAKEPVDRKGKMPHFSLHRLGRSTPEPDEGAGPSNSRTSPRSEVARDPAQSEDDIVTALHLQLAPHLTPSHAFSPITVSHVIHWSLLVTNADGHLSELYCTLPIMLMDAQLLHQVQKHTRFARRLLFVGPDDKPQQSEENGELPSYIAHVRDRVANMFITDGNSLRVTNPWIHAGVSPTLVDGEDPKSSGTVTPLQLVSDTNDAYVPDPDHPVFLDWVSAELLISHGVSKMHTDSEPPSGTHTPRDREPAVPPLPPTPSAAAAAAAAPLAADGARIYTHDSPASHERSGIFTASMEPTSALSHPYWLLSHRPDPHAARVSSNDLQKRVREICVPAPQVGSSLLHRAFTEVPDYDVALKGFLGGVPPLTSSIGLPSYEEAERAGSPVRTGSPA